MGVEINTKYVNKDGTTSVFGMYNKILFDQNESMCMARLGYKMASIHI